MSTAQRILKNYKADIESNEGEILLPKSVVKSSSKDDLFPTVRSTTLQFPDAVDRITVISESSLKRSIKNASVSKTEDLSKLHKKVSRGSASDLKPQKRSLGMQRAMKNSIVNHRKLFGPTLNRNLSVDASITSYGDAVTNGFQDSKCISDSISDAKPGAKISTPNPNDILFPLSGMTQWPGNEFFMEKIDACRREFLTCGKRSEQAKIALKVVRDVTINPGVRFLSRKRIESSSLEPTSHWVIMDENSVLVQLGRAFRGEVDGDQRTKKEKVNSLKKAQRNEGMNSKAEFDSRIGMEQVSEHDRKKENEHDNNHDPFGPLMRLYTAASKGYSFRSTSDSGTNLKSRNSFENGKTSQNYEHKQPTKSVIKMDQGKRTRDTEQIKLFMKHQKEQSKRQKKIPTNKTSCFVEAVQEAAEDVELMTSSSLFHEGELGIPKGVTVRPSGKWQAQTYFCGHSRYVGVYPTSLLAAHAYRVVQSQLKASRRLLQLRGNDYSECSKDEVAEIFSAARRVADKSVNELGRLISTNKYEPNKTEQQLLAQLEKETI